MQLLLILFLLVGSSAWAEVHNGNGCYKCFEEGCQWVSFGIEEDENSEKIKREGCMQKYNTMIGHGENREWLNHSAVGVDSYVKNNKNYNDNACTGKTDPLCYAKLLEYRESKIKEKEIEECTNRNNICIGEGSCDDKNLGCFNIYLGSDINPPKKESYTLRIGNYSKKMQRGIVYKMTKSEFKLLYLQLKQVVGNYITKEDLKEAGL